VALFCADGRFGFGNFGEDLVIFNDGDGCCSGREGAYAGPREWGQLVGGSAEELFEAYERWELWRL
jgi:hypothetical protein